MKVNNKHKPAELVLWCDTELAIVLDPDAMVADPVETKEAKEFITGAKPWPTSHGAVIQLVSSGEVFCVHNETLESVKHLQGMV